MQVSRRQFVGSMASLLLPSWLIQPAKRRLVDLTTFCVPSWQQIYRYDMRKPFQQGDMTYATDGRIAVRVEPMSGDVRELEQRFPNAAGLTWDHDSLRGWNTWPDNPTPIMCKNTLCPECEGRGVIGNVKYCEACEGDGFNVDMDDEFLHEAECRECCGTGYDGPLCPNCKGNAIAEFPSIIEVGGVLVSVPLHRKIEALGPVEYCLSPGRTDKDPIAFRFAEGLGLVMPMAESCRDDFV